MYEIKRIGPRFMEPETFLYKRKVFTEIDKCSVTFLMPAENEMSEEQISSIIEEYVDNRVSVFRDNEVVDIDF